MQAIKRLKTGNYSTSWTTTQLPEQRDPLHSSLLYPSTNEWGIPDVAHTPISIVPKYLVPFKTRLRNGRTNDGLGIHFFMDDHRFQSAFSKPYAILQAIREAYTTALTPDYSVYRNWPRAMNIWNVYRSRWLGAFWNEQTEGQLNIIPTITWSDKNSYHYCFAGVPLNSVVAISTVGVHPRNTVRGAWSLFAQGLEAMIVTLKPSLIMCYGTLPNEFHSWATFKIYPTRWQDIREEQRIERIQQDQVLETVVVEPEEIIYGW